jgi:hypothetical protein
MILLEKLWSDFKEMAVDLFAPTDGSCIDNEPVSTSSFSFAGIVVFCSKVLIFNWLQIRLMVE